MSFKPRQIDDVIIQLLEVIPDNEHQLISDIKTYDRNLWNRAPELRNNSEFWIALGDVFNRNIPHIDTPWKQQLLNIFNGAA